MKIKIAISFIIILLCSNQFCSAEFKIFSLFQGKKNQHLKSCKFHTNNLYLPYSEIYMDYSPVLNVNIMYDVDIDGDGIPNRFDNCPATFGLASMKGCPPFDLSKSVTYGNPTVNLKKGDFNLIIEIFNSLEFDGDQQLLSKDSEKQLNSLVKFLKKEKRIYLYISSYVNVSANRMKNYYLSESRAKSVRDYLVKNGIDDNRIATLFFGDMMPVVDLPATRFEVEICDKKK